MKGTNYGLPYQGSKAQIVESICLNFPNAENFFDLFGGGGSVTHYMALQKAKNYKTFHYNEIQKPIAELFRKAVSGFYSYDNFKPDWISREMFFELKYSDPYISLCWSFGNNQKDYLFGEDIEPFKKSGHMAVVFDELDETSRNVLGFDKWPMEVKTITQKRLYWRQRINYKYKATKTRQLEQLQQLQQLERLEQLQRLQQLQRLDITSLDYRDVQIPINSVVYCDIPYKGTRGYKHQFDHDTFFDWAATRKFPVYISEYDISDKRFKLIYSISKQALFDNSKSKKNVMQEKLYWNGV